MLNGTTTVAVIAVSLLLFPGAPRPPAQGGERHLWLTNDTRQPIVEIHVRDADSRGWQPDLLGRDFLQPGNSVYVDVDERDGRCRVDVMMVFDDGSDIIDRSVDVCRGDGYSVSVR